MAIPTSGIIRSLPVLLLLLISLSASAQRDTTFWFAAPDITEYQTPQFMRLTALNKAAEVTITQPANAGFAAITRTIATNSTVTIDFSSLLSQVENSGANVVTNKGLLISSTAKILAIWEPNAAVNPDLFSLKGKNALGTDFIVTAQKRWGSFGNVPSSFYVVATENATTITITPSVDLVGHPKSSGAYTVNLNRGQVYVADATTTTNQTVGGTTVTSNKPVAITMANDLTAAGFCGDLNGDQLVPNSLAQDKFITLPGGLDPGLTGGTDVVYVYPVQDNTQITVNGTVVATKNRGEYYEILNNGAVNYILTSQPSQVYQVSGYQCEVGGAILPGLDCTGSTTVGVTRSTSNNFTLVILIKAGKEGGFTFNGSTSAIPATAFSDVPSSNGEWKWASILNPGTLSAGQTAIISNKYPFHLGIINGGTRPGEGGTRYGYFSNFGDFEPDIFVTPDTFGDLFTSVDGIGFQWVKGGIDIGGATGQNYSATESGKYQVKVSFDANCPAGISEPIKIALTPANVGDFPLLWLRADKGVTETSGAVSDWLDTSGSDNHHTQSTASNKPGFNSNIANFNPALTFDGSQWIQDNDGIFEAGVQYPTTQLFLVHNSEPVGNRALYGQYVQINGNSSSRYMGHGEFNGTQYFGVKADNGNDWVQLPNGAERLNAYVINTFAVNSAKSQQLWFNGGDLFQAPLGGNYFVATNPAKPWVTGAGPLSSGSFSNPTAFRHKGQIAEMIVFETDLPEYKRHRVETYLAIKYGSQVTHNYYNTRYDGTNAATTTVYNVSTYGKNIAGIARDDQGAFYQKQGRSQNSVQYARMLTMGIGEIAESNALNTNTIDNGTYLVWGDDGNAPAEKGNDPTNPSAKILGRIWKIQATGNSPNNVTVHFDLTGVTTSATSITDLRLSINRQGIAYFSPDAVDYYDADPSSTLTSVVFKNVQWDTDGSGYDLFTLQTSAVECTVAYIPKITQNVVDPCDGPVELSVSGAALDLDGNDDFVEIPNVLVGATNFTFESWVYYRGESKPWARIIDFGNDVNEYMILTIKSDQFAAVKGVPMVAFSRTSSAGEIRIYSDIPFPLNQWAHIAFTIEGTTGKLYINGQIVGRKDNMTLTLKDLPPTTKNYIGRSQYDFDPLLNAKIDEMRFWTEARTQEQIVAGLRTRFPNNYPNLVGYYSFDEGRGDVAYDGSVNAGEGRLKNGVKWETPSSSPSGSFKSISWSTASTDPEISVSSSGSYMVNVVDSRGCTASLETTVLIGVPEQEISINDEQTCPVDLSVSGYGLVFDGADDHVEINNNLSTAKNFAFEAWVLWEGGGQWQRIFDFGSGAGVNMFFTVLSNDGKPRFAINLNPSGNVSTEQRILSNTVMPQYQWTHMAVTIENGVGRMFMNGVQVGINTSMTSFPSNLGATTQNWLGRSQYPDPYFKGKMDEVRFWNIARSAAEINQYKNFRFPANYPGLVAYYQFDEGKGLTTTDKTPVANIGSLENGTKWEAASSPSGTFASYLWSTGETTPLITVTTAGAYSVEVTDANGCKASASISTAGSLNLPAPVINAEGETTFCYGIGVKLTASEPSGLIWYRDGTVLEGLTGQTITVLDSGLYSLSFDRNGCISDTSAETEINIDLGCDQDGDGVTDGKELKDLTGYLDPCDLIPASQTLPPSSAWASADCDDDDLPNGAEVTLGTSLTLSDSDGDGVIDGTEVNEETDPLQNCSFVTASQTQEPDVIWQATDCDGDGVTNQAEKDDMTDFQQQCSLKPSSQTLEPSGTWKNFDCDGDGVTNADEVTDGTDINVFCSFVLESQTVTPSIDWKTADCDKDGNLNATDPNIETPTAVNDDIGILEADYAKFNVLTNDDFLPGNKITIQRVGGTAKGTEVINQQTGEVTYRSFPGEVGTVTLVYKVCNTAVTPAVCAEATVTLDITITELTIPEGFSPNGNGKNDKWVINGLEAYPDNKVKVFNRWGNEVFSAAPYKYSWDEASVSGGRVPAGTYYYVLDLGNGKKLTGYVYIAY